MGLSNRSVICVMGLLLLSGVSSGRAGAGSVLYVDDSATELNDGSSWCDAFTSLQDALDAAAGSAGAITEIRVAQGLYTPDVGSRQTSRDRVSTFTLVNGVNIRGGFAGCGEASPNDRAIDAFQTILSGDLARNDVGNRFDASRADNCYHVVTTNGTDSTAGIDGVIITSGRADGPDPHYSGAGFYNDGGSPTLLGCRFQDNWASVDGGAIYNRGGASPLIDSCTIVANSAFWGGGINNDDGSSPSMIRCVIAENTVADQGGGIHNRTGSSPFITDCTIVDNEAWFKGGGVANVGGSNPTLLGCLLEGNRSGNSGGGGMYNEESGPILRDVRFVRNNAKFSGGAMFNSLSDPVLEHCVFQFNEARNGGAVLNIFSSFDASNCLFEQNRAGFDGGALYNRSDVAHAVSVNFLNCTFRRNVANRIAGGIFNVGVNPSVRNCILWDNMDADGVVAASQIGGEEAIVDYSCIQGFDVLNGVGNTNDNPLFVRGLSGCAYLSQEPAGDPANSPCVDAGGDMAVDVDLDSRTTRTDGEVDAGTVDMGYHFAVTNDGCVPSRYQCEEQTDLREIAGLAVCFNDTGVLASCCTIFDVDESGSVDLADFKVLHGVLVGP